MYSVETSPQGETQIKKKGEKRNSPLERFYIKTAVETNEKKKNKTGQPGKQW